MSPFLNALKERPFYNESRLYSVANGIDFQTIIGLLGLTESIFDLHTFHVADT